MSVDGNGTVGTIFTVRWTMYSTFFILDVGVGHRIRGSDDESGGFLFLEGMVQLDGSCHET